MENSLKISPESGDTLELYIDPVRMPDIYERKIQCLLLSGMTRPEAEKFILKTPLVLELFYDIGRGLFAVESEAVGSTPITNPYTGHEIPEIED